MPPKKTQKKKSSRSEREEEYDNTNHGVLFKNDRKKTKNHPDYTGSFTDSEGNDFWLAGWVKESREGQKYISIAATAKEEKEEEEDEEEEEEEDETPRKKGKGKKSKKSDDLPF
jgi:hypothetical protein